MWAGLLCLLLLLFIFSPVHAAGGVVIYQALPNPTDESAEWIDLKNLSDQDVDISNYILDDEADGGSKPYHIPANTHIAAGSTLRIPKSQSGIILNNAKQTDQPYADEILLLDPAGNLIDKLSYTSTQTDVPVSHDPPPTPTVRPVPTSTPSPPPRPSSSPTPRPLPSSTPIPVSSSPTIAPLPKAETPQPTAVVDELVSNTPTPAVIPSLTPEVLGAAAPSETKAPTESNIWIGELIAGTGGIVIALGIGLGVKKLRRVY